MSSPHSGPHARSHPFRDSPYPRGNFLCCTGRGRETRGGNRPRAALQQSLTGRREQEGKEKKNNKHLPPFLPGGAPSKKKANMRARNSCGGTDMVSPYTKKMGFCWPDLGRRRLRKVRRRDERLLSSVLQRTPTLLHEPGIGAGRKTQAATRPCVPSEN